MKRALTFLLIMTCLLCGCATSESGKTEGSDEKVNETENPSTNSDNGDEEVVPRDITYTVWNAYWNLDGAEEQIDAMSDRIRNVDYFAAYFDANDQVFLPEETIDFYGTTREAYRENGWKLYMSVVNDQILADGSSSLKSLDLVWRLVGSEEAYKTHADQLVEMATSYGFDGLEIDYENLRKDDLVWEPFMAFVLYLQEKCEANDLELRIVLETDIPASEVDWVEGPTYVVMCYNLYGSHGGAGPKANYEFFDEIMEKMSYVPGDVDYALANGGFDWASDGTVKSLTTTAAEELLSQTGASMERDSSSDVAIFTYTDESGLSHEVWYGDEETVDAWVTYLTEHKIYEFSIWRVGR